MTHLCYTLDEAAERLNLSETVLVRLSQYFKVPRHAYEAVGYLSFKGDLTFSDQDIAFFRQVKERLLTGESLDDIKSRIRDDAAASMPVDSSETGLPGTTPAEELAWNVHPPQDVNPEPQPAPSAGLQTMVDSKPYEKAAEESFARYKSAHRTGLSRVFQNMMKEVGSTVSAPHFKPLRDKAPDWPETAAQAPDDIEPTPPAERSRTVLPFRRPAGKNRDVQGAPGDAKPGRPSQTVPSGHPTANYTTVPQTALWEQLIAEAAQRPRVLNAHLKSAAALLRDRALQGQPAQPEQDGAL